ncbi:MAG: heat-inducible transcription repressor HrcA [Clostridiales bacterium]|nr:heat-inducible transcription repressor HrcA [Clostridiales bacterium]
MQLDERKFMILKAIIDDYVMTGLPVGSRTISRKSGVGFSPATIRNEMSDLEELGYLDQPHTSAGRIPSNKAYRLYVDRLLNAGNLSIEDSLKIQEHLDKRAAQVEEVIRTAAQVLSDATHYTSIIVAPQAPALRIRRVQLVPITDNTALLIIVTNAGIVKDAVVRVPGDLTPDHLHAISTFLTEQLADKPIDQVRQCFHDVIHELSDHRRLLASVMNALETRIAQPRASDIIVGGSTNLLNYPEYADIEKARNFLAVLDSKEKLARLLRSRGGMEITIRIGKENEAPELQDCSLVTATYHIGSGTSGTLGVIGPTRMDYKRVITVLRTMAQTMSDLLSGE